MTVTLDLDFTQELNDPGSTQFIELRDNVESAVGLCSDTFCCRRDDLNSQSACLTAAGNL